MTQSVSCGGKRRPGDSESGPPRGVARAARGLRDNAAGRADTRAARRMSAWYVLWLLSLLEDGTEVTDDQDVVCATAALVLIVSAAGRLRDRHYLTRAALPLTSASAWRLVKEYDRDDMAWLEFTSLTRPGFIGILREFQPAIERFWREGVQDRPGRGTRTGPVGVGRPRSMRAADVLGLVLHYIHSTSSASVRCQLFGISPAVQCRCLLDGMHVLLLVLKVMPLSRVRWPSAESMRASASRIHASQPMLPGVFMLLDTP